MKLEPVDISFHFIISFVVVIFLGSISVYFGFPYLMYLFAVLTLFVFYAREKKQQSVKNHPPVNSWFFWKWGPRGLSEFLITIPGVVLALISLNLI